MAKFSEQPFHVMTKPIGPICNLDCKYCYYLHKEDLYPSNNRWKLSDQTLESYIRQYIEAQPAKTPEVTFAWQGGEPTLLGIDFFERCVELQKKHARPGMNIVNSIQTNGVLLDQDWCLFLKRHQFLVGLSIDGPAEWHDEYRTDSQGQGSHANVIRGLRLLKKFAVEFNAMVVLHRTNASDGKRMYRYLRDSGCRFMQFIPIVEPTGIGRHSEGEPQTDFADYDQRLNAVSSRSVDPDQFGQFLCDVFDEWKKHDIGRVFVQIFDQALGTWLGVEPSLCVFKKTCGQALAMEHNGDVYCCDHFVDSDHLLGNLNEKPLLNLINSGRQEEFGQQKSDSLPDYCRQCEVLHLCHGECPKNRILKTPSGENGLNYLCAGYRRFFNDSSELMQQMARLIKAGKSPALAMQTKSTP